MSKANPKFVQADEAVSPVIGVILMVAITVVLAAVVFVLVSNLSKTSDRAEEAAATARSPSTEVLEVTLVKVGEKGPYTISDTACDLDADPSCANVTINGVLCASTATGVTFPAMANWAAGGVVRLDGSGTPTGCAAQVVGGDEVSVNISVAGTLILSTSIVIQD